MSPTARPLDRASSYSVVCRRRRISIGSSNVSAPGVAVDTAGPPHRLPRDGERCGSLQFCRCRAVDACDSRHAIATPGTR